MRPCQHSDVYTDCSPAAAEAGYVRPPPDKRWGAVTFSGRKDSSWSLATYHQALDNNEAFPGPLVLPGDDLAEDSEYPPQSLRSWNTYNKKLPVTMERKTIYVVPPPNITKDVKRCMKDWEKPRVPKDSLIPGLPDDISSSRTGDVVDYLKAFYHKMEVKALDQPFEWAPWDTPATKPKSKKAKTEPPRIGLVTPGPASELVGIRYRPSLDGIAKIQLNLDDMLDALLECIPSDAYAIVMLADHDLYENDDDDFCCGRAYGESRIAIVSSFRYHPSLDQYSDIDMSHMWPASHCREYVDDQCDQGRRPAKKQKMTKGKTSPPSAIRAAIQAANMVPKPKTRDEWAGIWFSRVARTTSHELGHCLGMDHCVYYACSMQGTGRIAEDVRQPPYLCPVCVTKLSTALCIFVANGSVFQLQRQFIKGRYSALKEFCGKWDHVAMFAGFQAWIEKRLEEIQGFEEEAAKAGTR